MDVGANNRHMNDPKRNEKKVPPEWGEDSLSEFIENAWHNTFATFHNLKSWYVLLRDTHLVFDSIAHNLDRTPDWFASFFLFRSHSAFLASVRLALSGQIPEAYMVLRGCLENAFYGLYLTRTPTSRETWLRRHDNEKCKRTVRREFKVQNLLNLLKSEDVKLHYVASGLYDRTIDLGGHPNEKAFFSVMKQKKDDSELTFDSGYLIANEPALHLALKSCAQIGICALSIFQRIYPERFDILGLSDQLNLLKKGL